VSRATVRLEVAALWPGEPPAPGELADLGGGASIRFEARLAAPIPDWLARQAGDPAQTLTEAERQHVLESRSILHLSAAIPAATEVGLSVGERAAGLVRLIAGLLARGAVAVWLPAAQKMVGPSAWAAAREAAAGDIAAVVASQLLQRHVVIEADSTTWIHTHGMEQIGLPDVECRTAGAANVAHLLVGDVVRHLIQIGVLDPGTVVEIDAGSSSVRARLASTRAPEHLGAFGGLEITIDGEEEAAARAAFIVWSLVGDGFGSLQVVEEDSARLAFARAVIADGIGVAPTDLLVTAATAASRDGRGGAWPHRMAAGLEMALGNGGASRPGADSAFTAVEATASRVSVYTGGELRVHLLDSAGALTRRSDLGSTCVDWPVRPPYRILVCSSHYHRDRSPEAYVEELGERVSIALDKNRGLLVWIDVVAPAPGAPDTPRSPGGADSPAGS
jgi:hypothetical protein